jgi:hypothetical protein
MWCTSPPIVTVAWATGWPRLIACPSGRGVTVIVTGVPGQAVTLTPEAGRPALRPLRDVMKASGTAALPARVPVTLAERTASSSG